MIRISNIIKKYNKLEVLKGIDAELQTGKVTAIVGPNGSGKTTLIKIILGLVKADFGFVEIDGTKINGDYNYKNNIGYMPQIARYPENLTVFEVLSMIKDLRNRKDQPEEKLLKEFELSGELTKAIRTLSGGNRQKLSTVISLMFDPKFLIFDEPTAGLDPVISNRFKEMVFAEKQKGKTIILTSHIMSEVEELADEIIFLLEGKIFYKGSLQNLLIERGESKLEKAVAKILEEKVLWN
ncbi:ABC-type transport system ATPase component [Ignavibacterium album JCM 16511]|uniref:ABC-type transport system ATPase component n=1 Tax=Ignavibacterium album (strain DSM 19864 / JCM 16511 / NBRC 101810 / Mat9-16) TaxID=945713 RepID=I0AHV8_IGNAJ|nr:ABC transporter ATP-binding protein [Ignavibacterium album]AFH48565.1 ABC-type transport system ATPase component [Ignavibacterium album JCM 16511]